MSATILEIRQAYAQDLVEMVVKLKDAFGLPTEEAFVALYAAVGLFEAGAANTGFPVDKMKEYQEVGLGVGRDFYESQKEAAEKETVEAEPTEETKAQPAAPTLGMGASLGGDSKPEPGVVGPGEGSGLVNAEGKEVRPDALTLQGSQAVVEGVGGATMAAMFPMGAKVHMLDALALVTGAQKFIEKQIPKGIEDWQIRKVKLSAASAVERAITNRKDGVVVIDDSIFGSEGSQTIAEIEDKGTGLVGLDGKEMMKQ
jgi:hypothetical protein